MIKSSSAIIKEPRSYEDLKQQVKESLSVVSESLDFKEAQESNRKIERELIPEFIDMSLNGLTDDEPLIQAIGVRGEGCPDLEMMVVMISRLQVAMVSLHERMQTDATLANATALAHLRFQHAQTLDMLLNANTYGIICRREGEPFVGHCALIVLPPSFNGFKDEMQ